MDCDDYCEITSQLDAREILRYLNDLGIRNVSGEVLRCFITDLKKLIKYDLQHRNEVQSARSEKSASPGLERLHSASTFSSRKRSRVQQTEVFCQRQCHRPRTLNIRLTQSAPALSCRKADEKLARKACSCVRVERKDESPKEPIKTTVSNNLIKVPIQAVKRKSDPVSLYHYYTSLWAKYKPNVPGENNWSDLRWSIRQKMVGNVPLQTNKAIDKQEKETIKKKTS